MTEVDWVFQLDEIGAIDVGKTVGISDEVKLAISVILYPVGLTREMADRLLEGWRYVRESSDENVWMNTDGGGARVLESGLVEMCNVVGVFPDCLIDGAEFYRMLQSYSEFIDSIADQDGGLTQ